VNLTGKGQNRHIASAQPRSTLWWTAAGVVLALLLIFWLDRVTDDAPVQHLYYAPIILAAMIFGNRGGVATSLAAIVLYHVANPETLSVHYRQGDVVQVALFLAVGLVTARLIDNSRRLRRLATTDDLTGLHNLRSFEAKLDAIIREAGIAGVPLSMLVIDVDRLKSINDAHGHLAGAEAVQEVGRIIAATMPPGAVACRYGGDEFAVVLPRHESCDAVEVAVRLRNSVRAAAPVLAGLAFPAGTLSASVGVATWSFEIDRRGSTFFPDPASVGDVLFRAADAALYAAKEGGRDQVVAERWES
jgi:diguanylate cyclase (GGDEF)-like protein